MSYIEEFQKIGIYPRASPRSQKLKCPWCQEQRSKNKRDTPLAVDIEEGVYNCHHCGKAGSVRNMNFQIPKKTYTLPKQPQKIGVNDKARAYLISRGITEEIIANNKLISTNDGNGISFPYYRNGEMVNYKVRYIDDKRFLQAKDAEPIMYNLDRITGQKEIIISEGEFDSMSWEVAGFTNHTSVNQGAPNVNDKSVDKKLECYSNCIEVFDNAEKVYIAVDNDPNGVRLRDELVRRIGAEKCYLVDFKDCKDANEYLIKYGGYELAQLLRTAKIVKPDGIYSLEDVQEDLMCQYKNGFKKAESTHNEHIDSAWRWRTGEVNVWTGYMNEGKTNFLLQLSVLKAGMDGDRFALFSPENTPIADLYRDLIEMYIGKTSDIQYSNRMTEEEYVAGLNFINEYFFIIHPNEHYTLETIFPLARFLVKKFGIRHLILDPYNTIEHDSRPYEQEHLYISRFMTALKRFATDNEISMHLVAHQVTPNVDNNTGNYPKPDIYKIKGGGTFADKADNVLIVWRPNKKKDFRDSSTVFGSQKIKKQKIVAKPNEIYEITFDPFRSRYSTFGNDMLSVLDYKRTGNKPKQIDNIVTDFQDVDTGNAYQNLLKQGRKEWGNKPDFGNESTLPF
ncbi:MAG: toprim domain-containing protein [Taibaiella sp.]|nr:toprim domain-containing protein [Taibaiella sp.]